VALHRCLPDNETFRKQVGNAPESVVALAGTLSYRRSTASSVTQTGAEGSPQVDCRNDAIATRIQTLEFFAVLAH
jgi:hypothetical protein